MCGLVGMMNQNQHFQGIAERLAGMRGTLTYCGLEDMDLLIQGNIGIGLRRLSIVDLSPRGRQPFQDEDDSRFFILNGEIYSYVEIWQQLVKRGHRFSRDSDSEVVLHR